MYMDSIKYNEITQVNRASRKAYEQIQSEGIKDVYYLSREDLNIPSGGWVDYVHPSDFGMQQQAAAVERKVREILHIPLGSLTTTIPSPNAGNRTCMNGRLVTALFWSRYATIRPKAVILGNSDHPLLGWRTRTPQQERTRPGEKVMRPAGFQNLGCGWDRIEMCFGVYTTKRTGRLQSRKSRLDDRHEQLWPEQRQGYRRRSPLPPFRHPSATTGSLRQSDRHPSPAVIRNNG